jgi:hypothetical protein
MQTWYYIEFKVTLSTVTGANYNSDGAFNLRLNGRSLTGVVSGVITRNSTDANFTTYDTCGIGRAGISFDYYFDDWYILNPTADGLTDPLGGPTINNNDFLGDCKVGTILPEAASLLGAGHTDLTPSTGANWQNVDDDAVAGTAPDTANYNSSPTPEASDTYQYQDITVPTGAKIYAVQLVPHLSKSEAGLKYASCLCDVGVNQHEQASVIVPDSGAYLPFVMKSPPAAANALSTTGWTKANIDGAEFGIRVKAA